MLTSARAALTEFEFGTTGRILFGRGTFARIGELAAEFGHKAFVVTGARSAAASGALARLEDALNAAGVRFQIHEVHGEPTVEAVDELCESARFFAAPAIVALGGGSAIDAAKAVAALTTNTAGDEESIKDFLEGVGAGRKIVRPPKPTIAVPTTAGTGAEVTKNAVISASDRSFKKSVRAPSMRPAVAVVDPELTVSAPPDVTAACGADAVCQLVEAYTSLRANVFTDALAREGIRLAVWALERVLRDGGDMEAREGMAMASLLGGIALDNAGLGAVHGFASPVGAFFPAPHGVVCANLLPEVVAANIRVARARRATDPWADRIATRYREIAALFNGDFTCEAEQLPRSLAAHKFMKEIPSLSQFGVADGDIPRIVANCRGGSMKTNPFDLDDRELTEILERALER